MRQRIYLGNSIYKKAKEKESQIIVLCIRRPTDKQRLEKPANNMQPNSENILNVVTTSMLILIHLQMTYTSLLSVTIQFWQYKWTYLRWVECEIEQATQVEQEYFVTADDKAYVGVSIEVLSVCDFNVLLAVKTAWHG